MIHVFGKLKIPVKQEFDKQVLQTSPEAVIPLLSQDPKVSHMDVLVFKDEDLPTSKRKSAFASALEERHPDVEVICFSSSDKSIFQSVNDIQFIKSKASVTRAMISESLSPILEKVQTRADRIKTNPAGRWNPEEEEESVDISDIFGESLWESEESDTASPSKSESLSVGAKPKTSSVVSTLSQITPKSSKEKAVEENNSNELNFNPTSSDIPFQEFSIDVEEQYETESSTLTREESNPEFQNALETSLPLSELELQLKEEKNKSLDYMIRSKELNADALRDLLSTDTIASKLMKENAHFQGALELLEALNLELINIHRDTILTPSEKFLRIKNIGIEKASRKDFINNKITEELLTIINNIVQTVETVTEERIEDIGKKLYTTTEIARTLVSESTTREEVQMRLLSVQELQAIIQEIIMVYDVINEETANFIKTCTKDLPSTSPMINEFYRHTKQLFLPAHLGEIINRIQGDLRDTAGRFNVLESKLQRLQKCVLDYAKATQENLAEQISVTNLLKAQRVEDLVITDSILKSALRAFIGPSDVGRTSTIIMRSSSQAKTRNTLVINMSSEINLLTYGIHSVDEEDFFNLQIYKPLLYVNLNLGQDVEKLRECLDKLTPKLKFFHHINLLFDETQMNMVRDIASDLKMVSFISNSKKRSVDVVKELVKDFITPNVARQLIIIEPPKDVWKLVEATEIDPTITQLITIPYCEDMREATLKGVDPSSNPDLCLIYDEAFNSNNT